MYWCFKKHMKKYLYKKIHIAKLWYIFLEERRFWCFREESAQDFSPRHLTKFNSRWVFFFSGSFAEKEVPQFRPNQADLWTFSAVLFLMPCFFFCASDLRALARARRECLSSPDKSPLSPFCPGSLWSHLLVRGSERTPVQSQRTANKLASTLFSYLITPGWFGKKRLTSLNTPLLQSIFMSMFWSVCVAFRSLMRVCLILLPESPQQSLTSCPRPSAFQRDDGKGRFTGWF